MIQMVRYYRIPDGRNAGIALAFGEWPERVLKHRGWTPSRCVCQRVATKEEHDWLAECLRFQAFHYPSVEGLLEDEGRVLDPATLDAIKAAFRLAAPHA